MDGLRILITNHGLKERAGSELYVRELALGLLRSGHSPIVYSPKLGEVATEIRKATVPVVDDLSSVSVQPDLIHGHHHVETMTALLHFPHVPAVFFCHGWLPWEETPPHFPRILRYVAVDDTCRDRLVCEHGIAEERVRVILNFVDLERFAQRAELPAKARRALVFSNNASESSYVAHVREACRRAGISLEVVGLQAGRTSERPEKLLGQYDIVFAKARCALEALAVGTAVVLCDQAGLGPIVTTTNLERLRRLNFGIRTLQQTIDDPEAVEKEIARYDATDAMEVSRRLRSVCGFEDAFSEILALYREVIAEQKQSPLRDAEAESRAAAEYVRQLPSLLARERDVLANSATFRLRNRLLKIPIAGSLARSLSQRITN
jgi:glycosyl transferase family 4